MILIFGGAYQGKREYAIKKFNIKKIASCNADSNPDFGVDCVCDIESFVIGCVERGEEAKEYFETHRSEWADKVLIITDTSQGVVPVDDKVRAAREMNGRLMIYLAERAREVHRVFCGIGKRIK